MSLPTIKPSEARRLLDSGALLIDIREADEHARERKSAAARSTLSIVPDVKLRRLEPPACLSAPEQALWREITAAVRPDWFKGASGFLLELYVRLLQQARDLAVGIEREQP